MDKVFLTKQNTSIIFDIVKKRIIQTLGFDISRDERFQNELIKIMNSVYSKRQTFQYPPNATQQDYLKVLTQNAVNIAIGYFTDNITKMNNKNDNLNREILKKNNTQINNSMSQRPTNSSLLPANDKGNVASNYAQLLKEREFKAPMPQMPQSNTPNKPVNFQDKNTGITNDDVAKRFSELSMARRSEYDNLAPVVKGNQNQNQGSNQFEHPSMQQSNLSQNAMIPSNSQPTNAPYFNQPNPLTQTPNLFQNNFLNSDTNMGSILEQQFNNANMNIPQSNVNTSQYTADQANQFQQSMGRQPSFNQGSMQYNNDVNSNPSMPSTIVNMESDNINLDDLYSSMQMNSQYNPVDNTNTSTNSSSNGFTDTFEQNFSNPLNSLNPTFDEKESSIDKLFPKNPYEHVNNTTKQSVITPNPKISAELEIIKQSIDKHQSYIDATTQKIDKLVDSWSKQDLGRFYNTIIDIPRLIQAQKEQPLTIRTHNLIVSSKDRNLNNTGFDKYNFRVVFGADGDYKDINYTNNNINSGLNTVNLNSNTYVSSSSSNPSVQQVLKNVTSIKLSRVIIPKPRSDVFYPDPYYLVSIDEFNSNIISTKSFTEKIFCKIVFDKEVKFSNRSYMYYLNNDEDYTMFYSSPLGKLDRLSIKLLDSDGESVKETFNDIDWVNTDAGSNSSQEFVNNTFVGDKILQNGNNKYVVSDLNTTTSTIETKLRNIVGAGSPIPSSFIVNLSNQIEYIFEVKTTEPDSTNLVRPSIN